MNRRQRYKMDRNYKHQQNVIGDVYCQSSPVWEPEAAPAVERVVVPDKPTGEPGKLERWCAACRGLGKEFFQKPDRSIGEVPCPQCDGTGRPPAECRKSASNPSGEHQWGYPDPHSAFCFNCKATASLIRESTEEL